MKMHLFVAGALLSIGSYLPVQAQQSLPPKKEVLKTLTLANRYFMEKWPDAGKQIVLHKTWPSNIWTRAVYYEGLIELYKIDPQKSYYDYAVQWGEKHNWGLRGGIMTRNADNQACGQTYIDLYLIDKKREEKRIHDIKASIDTMMHTDMVDDWDWIDAIQMAMPVMARLGKIYNDTAYFRRMYEMYAYAKFKHGTAGLYNTQEYLWWRDKDFVPPYKEPNGSNCYWSRGNGWVLAALVRTMEQLPQSSPYYNIFLQDFKDMSAALLKIQRPDGFWNVSLHDADHFGGKELTGTSLFVYGMAWGVRKGYLDKKTYQPVIAKAWNALEKECVHDNGMLGYVQSTGKQPSDGQPVTFDKIPDFEDYGLGCFLLAGTEVYKSK
ncbi:glycoside hydrolase family 88/105 protein [Chitinophaga agri]|uniref:Glycoside hydrolase family 88 protein n=1 Tax=Chitinophaga agri TaxID=2703787 RepID=A0A6B9ZK85_9BACT|nr:glycoside hydrolase family 88 protein [Chitinophaga agri]QHS62406.1 glycoside hydrolase family 88 protein [Chitinophaga agri]